MLNIFVSKLLLVALISVSLFGATKLHEHQSATIYNANGNKATVNIAHLKAGESGVIIHTTSDNKKVIVADAIVTQSNDKNSKLLIKEFKNLTQDALPAIKNRVNDGDTFISRHLYSSSMAITPNKKAYDTLVKGFSQHNFIHPDLFATYLKKETTLYPSKEDIQKFLIQKDIGTLFVYLNDTLYIFDSKSMKPIKKSQYPKQTHNKEMFPFYTRIKKIENGFWNIKKDDLSFETHYSKILGLTL